MLISAWFVYQLHQHQQILPSKCAPFLNIFLSFVLLCSCLAACLISLSLKRTDIGCSSKVIDSPSLPRVRFRVLHTCAERVRIRATVFGVPPVLQENQGLTLCPNASSCFLMRGDDLVIYDASLGSEQTTLHTAVGMPLSKAIISQLPSRSAWFPTVKSRSQVYSTLKAAARAWGGALARRSKCHLTLTEPLLNEHFRFSSCLTLLWNTSMKLWNNFSSSDVCLQSVRENRCWNIWSLVNCY